VKLAPEACESLVCSHRTNNGCVFRNRPYLVGGVISASVYLSCQVKDWSLRRGQTNDGGVDVIPLLGGIILHVLHALPPLAPRCEFVSDVLALFLYSFRAGLGVAGSSVFSFVGVPLAMLVVMPLFVMLPCTVCYASLYRRDLGVLLR
jgi:hypothetical protein